MGACQSVKQGVVLGTDSSATFGTGQSLTVEQPTEKLSVVGDRVVIAGTGQVGLGQRFQAIVGKAWSNNVFQKSALEIGKHLTREAKDDFASTGVKEGQYGALVAFAADRQAHLCEFSTKDLQPELKDVRIWYCSLGSTQTITDSFLGLMRELFWKDGPPTVSEGIFAATWTLDHAVEVNPGGVNKPVRVAVLKPDKHNQLKAEILSEEVLDEHRQNVKGAKDALRAYCLALHGAGECGIPDTPKVK